MESVPPLPSLDLDYLLDRPLSAEELKALPLFQIAQSIWLLGLRASYINEWGELYFANWFIDRVLAGIRATFETIEP